MRWVAQKSFYTGVVGESFLNDDGTSRQDVILTCREGDVVWLIREPANPVDPNAVKVCRESGEQIGYLNRACARPTAADLDRGDPVGAVIASIGWGDSGLAGVVLYLTKYDLRVEPHEIERIVRRPTRIGSDICRIVRLGSGEEISEVWRDGLWQRPGPERQAFKHQRYVKLDELRKSGIPVEEPPEIDPPGPPPQPPPEPQATRQRSGVELPRFGGQGGVDPLSWTPDPLGRRDPRCRGHARRTHPSSAGA